jgi:DNA ligase 1
LTKYTNEMCQAIQEFGGPKQTITAIGVCILAHATVISEWRYAPGKVGKSDREQAYFEANAEMEKKLKLDYKLDVKDIDEGRNSIIKPMLAQPYEGWGGVCFAQPKLDGMRCLATPLGLRSRNDREIVSVPHIEKQLISFFKDQPNIILDGEIYNHGFYDNFNSIMSMAKKTKPSLKDLELSEKYLQYWIYDFYDQTSPFMHYSQRLAKISTWIFSNYVYRVDTKKIETEEELNYHYAALLSKGYEGQIVRYDKAYEQKRSDWLLKRKELVDAEFELIDIEEGAGQWSGMAKRALCRSDDGKTFGAGIAGTQEYCTQLLKEKNKYVSVTVKYQALTPDGVPRFPIAIMFYEEGFSELENRTMPRKDLFA